MYKTIIASLLLALAAFAGAAQASDHSKTSDRDRAQVTRETATDSRSDRDHDRYKRADRSHDRHHDADDRDDDDESHERSERR